VVKPFAESEDTECGAPKVKKPRGPPKKFAGVPGKWNADSGKWVPSKAQEEAASSASAPDESASDVGRAEEATVERLGRSSGGKGKFRKIWANIWPWLICASVLKADETCGSPAGASCPGCALCSIMRCVHCITRGKKNVLGVGSPGSKCFNKSTISSHYQTYHAHEHCGQASTEESTSRSIEQHKERILKIFLVILHMAAHKMAMNAIRRQAALLRMSGVHLGRSYVNRVMARGMLIALAFVIRQRYVIKPAQVSLALGLMIDESVDVSKSENMVLYLRFLFLGVFVTRFWRIVKCEKVLV